jgi:hypothetical protein
VILLLAMALAQPGAAADPAILQLRVVEGEGLVYATGSRATRGISLQVTNETGQPVEGVTVSFRLPDSGASGTFGSGTKTEIVQTRADGIATIWGMQWNRTAGPVQIRVTAVKGPVRAGAVTQVTLSDSVPAAMARESGGGSRKWLLWSAIIGGAAAAGLAAGAMGGGASSAGAVQAPAVRIGNPSISLGRPQ